MSNETFLTILAIIGVLQIAGGFLILGKWGFWYAMTHSMSIRMGSAILIFVWTQRLIGAGS